MFAGHVSGRTASYPDRLHSYLRVSRTSERLMPLMASAMPCVMASDELGLTTRMRVDLRRNVVVMVNDA